MIKIESTEVIVTEVILRFLKWSMNQLSVFKTITEHVNFFSRNSALLIKNKNKKHKLLLNDEATTPGKRQTSFRPC